MLPAPDLDDRNFQQLVDDAKRLVQQRCPEWTDHNVSDPGVTLIEAFAQMVDQLIYRLNRVPERNYVKFLEMIGVTLRPPAAARGTVTLWLSAPQPQAVVVRAGTQVATPRTDVHDPLIYTTVQGLDIVPCSFARTAVQPSGDNATDTSPALDSGKGFGCFSPAPRVGDALLIGLTDAVPSCAVLLRLDCSVAGVGVDPRRPPLRWEAWQGEGWAPCEVDRDETGGLNRPGDVVLHVPATHQTSVIARNRAGWLRCRLIEAEEDQPTYTASPRIMGVAAHTVGGTAPIMHAEVVRNEGIGTSDGTPGQRFPLSRRPVVPAAQPLEVEIVTATGAQRWQQVPHFAQSGPADRHFRLDAYAGEVHFGPAVRQADGTLRHFGAVPPRGGTIRVPVYLYGGGRSGNINIGQIRVLKSSVPYVGRVENRAPAVGGADAESLDDAKTRGPLLLRSRGRAVTVEDFEELAREAAPGVARVKCIAAQEPAEAGGVRLLVIPHLPSDELGRIRRDQLDPPAETLALIRDRLDACRLVGTRLLVTPPEYVGVTVVVSARAQSQHDPEEVKLAVQRALYQHFHPLTGGTDGTGWPFSRSVRTPEILAALARVPGLDLARDITLSLFPANPETGRRDAVAEKIDLGPTALVYSFEHQIRIR